MLYPCPQLHSKHQACGCGMIATRETFTIAFGMQASFGSFYLPVAGDWRGQTAGGALLGCREPCSIVMQKAHPET
jgi:hypothetical protein